MITYYRLSDGSYKKNKFENATKEHCLKNYVTTFYYPNDKIFLYLDNVKDKTDKKITKLINEWSTEEFKIVIRRSSAGSSAQSFRLVFENALELLDDEIVYFVEDDYWHLKGSRKAIHEALDRADYVSLYDHIDKYIPASHGGNPLVNEAGCSTFPTYLILTDSRHWRTVDSTTMTFAARVSTLQNDKAIWFKYIQGTHPFDMQLFHELMHRGRSLVTPVPSLSTHVEPQWAAPLIDWETEMEK